MITMRVSSSLATSTTAWVKRPQRSDGSTPCSITRSPSAPGISAAVIAFAGHSIFRVRPSVRRTVGRTAVKSKNSSGSM